MLYRPVLIFTLSLWERVGVRASDRTLQKNYNCPTYR
ncbi:hypothetical protein ENINCK372B1_18185 [Enterobacter intestinihominis]